jgi:hypothetical protein
MVATGIAPGSFYQFDADGNRQRAHFDGLPVEFIAEAIATLGAQVVDGFQTYHVMNPHDDGIGLDEYVDWVIEAGYPIQTLTTGREVQRMLGGSRSPASISVLCGCGATSPQLMRMGLGRAETSAAVIPSPRNGGMERCACNTRGQSQRRPRRDPGGQTICRPRACCVRDAHAATCRWATAGMCPSRSP